MSYDLDLLTDGAMGAAVGDMGARRLLPEDSRLVIASSHIFLLTIVSIVCGP